MYRTMPDDSGAEHGMLRVVDESGEDYVYPSDYFIPIKLPLAVQAAPAPADPIPPFPDS